MFFMYIFFQIAILCKGSDNGKAGCGGKVAPHSANIASLYTADANRDLCVEYAYFRIVTGAVGPRQMLIGCRGRRACLIG